ncbi:MAG: bacillithiol biosynthesis cysteine-adding enzyme BshC [Gemmatimonadota bacterium]|nr:bacillithiol biosynthesis cysteine-adding enzyme BshC [Gemmatimonadota bacterium]
MIRIINRELGGSALARAALAGDVPDWYAPRLIGARAWDRAASDVAADFGRRNWVDELLPALQPNAEVLARLRSVVSGGGVVVTGGQQPGLFGGPLYVLYKAITLVEMARAIEAATSRPCVPVFWAATDDTDFVEASHVSVVRDGRLEMLGMSDPAAPGRSMAATPLGDVAQLLDRLEAACAAAPDARVLMAVRGAYARQETVGSAYVTFLRSLLHPLGVAVLDASHAAVRAAGRATMVSALASAEGIATALRDRAAAIATAGYRPQVADVANLSLVFETLGDGTRRRVPLRAARETANAIEAQRLGPNVLLRPIMERQILPTVTYVGGPGEVAYFAQVSAVADAIGFAAPRVIPRWSGTVIEPDVQETMACLGATVEDFSDPHALEGRVARAAVPTDVRESIERLRDAVRAARETLVAKPTTSTALQRSIGAMEAGVLHRLARLERRYAAAVKQGGTAELRDVAHVRASLYPNGAPQERVLSFVPMLARYDSELLDSISEAARQHVDRVIKGG